MEGRRGDLTTQAIEQWREGLLEYRSRDGASMGTDTANPVSHKHIVRQGAEEETRLPQRV